MRPHAAFEPPQGEHEAAPFPAQDLTQPLSALSTLTVEPLAASSLRLLDALEVAVLVVDAQAVGLPITYVNPAFERLTGWTAVEAVGRDASLLHTPDTDPSAVARLEGAVLAGRPCRVTMLCRAHGGEDFWNEVSVTPLRDEDGDVARFLVTCVDVTDRVEGGLSSGHFAPGHLPAEERRLRAALESAEAEIERLASLDPLTGLPNRARLEARLRDRVARARRRRHAVALLFIDLDEFKLVNDSLGHAAGDRLIGRVAARLRGIEGRHGMLARQGGDEFAVLLDELPADQAERLARSAAHDVAVRLADPFRVAGAEFHVEASVGISLYPDDAPGAQALMQHADAAVHQSKARGRAASTVYTRGAHDPLDRLSLSARLRRAIAGNELEIHYQPIVWTTTGRLHSMEALLRWNDPVRGLVRPDDFIPAAEELGLLDAMGDWLLGAIARDMAAWRAEGHAPHVSFNVSPSQLHRPDFVASLQARLAATGLDPASLTMEVTESATVREPERIRPMLRELAAAGLGLAIDDFGAGWSSLARLRQLPVQTLKIDRSFLREVPTDPGAGAIVGAIVALADALGMRAVAEGVERPAQRDFLAAHGCALAQGRFLGEPVPAAMMTERLRTGVAAA